MKKRNQVITLLVIAGFVVALVLINRMEPGRISDEQAAEAAEAEELIAEAEQAEAEAKKELVDKLMAAAEEKAQQNGDEAAEKAAESEPADAESPNPYQVEFITSEGSFVVEVYPEWAPIGARRFREAVEAGIYNEARFFRVIPDFVVQFGIPGDPEVAKQWRERTIQDEPVKTSNARGTVTFAMSSAPNSRTTQVFINLRDNTQLDAMGFAPFGKVVKGMDVVESFNSEYLDQPTGKQYEIQTRGNAYLKEYFPNLDYIKEAKVLGDVAAESDSAEREAPAASPEA